MAETGSRQDPAVAFRFAVRIDGLAVGGFTECSGLQLDTEVTDYVEGGVNDRVHRFVTRTKQSTLVLKRGIVDRSLWDWFAEVARGRVSLRDGTVVLHDPSGSEVVSEWQFRRAFPSKWSGPDLNATQSSVAVETFELAHRGLERRR